MEVWKACATIYEHMVAEIRTGAKGEGEPVAQVWEGPEGFSRARVLSAAPEGLALARALVARSQNGGEIMMWRELDMAKAIIAKAGVEH